MIRFVPKIDLQASTIKPTKPQASRSSDAQGPAVSAAAIAGDNAEGLLISPQPSSAEPVAEPLALSGDAPVKKQAARRSRTSTQKKVKSIAVEPGSAGGDLLVGLEG